MEIDEYNIEEHIKPDDNCLLRSFSYFLYNNQEKHRKIRLRIVSNVIRNWLFYEPFILGDKSYGTNISDEQIYKSDTSKDGVFGGEV